MKNENSFSWLHLTDLHCGTQDYKWLWPGVRQIFFDDLRALHDRCGPWDLVLFTGDITYTGSPEEFQEVDEILEQLWKYLNELGSSPKFLAVPGNHDLVRPSEKEKEEPAFILLHQWEIQSELQQDFWRKYFWGKANSSYLNVIQKAFENYTKWWKKLPFKPQNVNQGFLPGDFSVTIEKNGAKLGILGLNTSFLQMTADNYKGKLSLHPSQFHGVCCDSDGYRWAGQHHACLFMTHHPPEWLNEQSVRDLKGEIVTRDNFVTHLCGHTHETVFQEIAEASTTPRRIWQGRSLFGLEYFGQDYQEQRSHGYSAGKIELSGGKGTIQFWPREARLQGGQRRIVLDQSVRLTDEQHTEPTSFTLLQPYEKKGEPSPLNYDIKQETFPSNAFSNSISSFVIQRHPNPEDV